MNAFFPKRQIFTKRMILAAAHASQAASFVEFYTREEGHLRPWSPLASPDLFTLEGQRGRLRASQRSFETGAAWRWAMMMQDQPNHVIGHLNFSQVVRGVFQSCMLGYELSAEYEGKGLMFEALQVGIQQIFQAPVSMHRIQANTNPDNHRSLKLLLRLGFQVEGTAREYLFIDGQWRDHLMTALINPSSTP